MIDHVRPGRTPLLYCWSMNDYGGRGRHARTLIDYETINLHEHPDSEVAESQTEPEPAEPPPKGGQMQRDGAAVK